MLSARYLASLSDQIVEMYSVLEYEIKKDMVKRLAKLKNITDATQYQMKIYNEVGGLRSDITALIEKYDAQTQKMVKELFYKALAENETKDFKMISSAVRSGKTQQQQVLKAKLEALEQAENVAVPNDANIDRLYARFYKKYQYDELFKSIKRMTMTIADTTQEEFIRECNNAYMKVSSGAFSYQQALKQGVDEIATTPLKTISYSQSGSVRSFSIESALRMNIMTGINQTASQQTLDNAEELGVDRFEVDAHIGARWSKYAQNVWSNHADWQGGIYTREELRTVCGLGEPDGLCGINCRHSFYPYIDGSSPLYSKGELDEMNDTMVRLHGKQVTPYEAEQELRGTECQIRKYKKQADFEKMTGLDDTEARNKLWIYQKNARDICEESGIKRDYSREYIGTKTGKQPTGLKPKSE